MENNSSTNYYEVLQSYRTASADELKKNYQRLVLSSHPDKGVASEDKFIQIQKAWAVLRDPESRRQYDATLACQEHNDHLLYDTIRLTDMVYDEAENVYTYRCRCGGMYLFCPNDSISNNAIVGCEECSFSIQVNR